jgi:hypothetical protein
MKLPVMLLAGCWHDDTREIEFPSEDIAFPHIPDKIQCLLRLLRQRIHLNLSLILSDLMDYVHIFFLKKLALPSNNHEDGENINT